MVPTFLSGNAKPFILLKFLNEVTPLTHKSAQKWNHPHAHIVLFVTKKKQNILSYVPSKRPPANGCRRGGTQAAPTRDFNQSPDDSLKQQPQPSAGRLWCPDIVAPSPLSLCAVLLVAGFMTLRSYRRSRALLLGDGFAQPWPVYRLVF